ncbi:hypothetical protein Cantr_10434 [Candida viswanathii]|uniref:Uncharacterized protein n=1 Tax=Candida viswanathii TaxID=5486 RepID=A0A367YDT4_9ASCO|nr:hypothetical protein Cantr_10434 [Candida viswanathii]
MPLNLLSHERDSRTTAGPMIALNEAYNDLRLSLIGNKDLKYKLVGDVQFIRQLASDFNQLINQLTECNTLSVAATNQILSDLEKLAVIINILCLFSIEVDNKKDENITQCLISMKLVLNPIIKLLNYFIQSFVPRYYANASAMSDELESLDIYKVKNLIGYALDILLGLTNSKDHHLDTSILWKFIISLLIVTDSNHHNVSLIDSSILIKLLRLVPLLLASNSQLTNDSLITLLTALLNRLSFECDTIISTHFGTGLFSATSSNKVFHQMAFEDSRLPNIELNKTILDKTVDVRLLQELITCTAQIFSFLKVHDYDIVMASPTDTSCAGINDSTKKRRRRSLNQPPSSPVIVLSIKVYLTLLLLVKFNGNKSLNLAALNLITFYLNNLKPSQDIDKQVIFKSYRKLFPRIICMLDLNNDYTGRNNKKTKNGTTKIVNQSTSTIPMNSKRRYDIPMFLLSPARILSDLCVQYPKLNDEIHDANVDYKIVEKLQSSYSSSKLLKALKVLKGSSKHGKNLVDFTVMLTIEKDEGEVADLLLLLSVYTGNREEYRNRIVNTPPEYSVNLASLIFDIVDDYYFLVNQLQLVYRLLNPKRRRNGLRSGSHKVIPQNDLPWFGRNLGIISTLHDSALFTNCFYFIRSISRSVATLRTFFVECNAFTSFSTDQAADPHFQPITRGTDSSPINSSVTSISTGREGGVSAGGRTGIGAIRAGPSAGGRSGENGNNGNPSSSLMSSGSASGGSPGGFIIDILKIIHGYENLYRIFEFFYNVNNRGNSPCELDRASSKKNLMINKSICIGLLANFILDFSSFRYKIIGYDKFLSSLLTIYQNATSDNQTLSDEEVYQRNTIQLKILQVIKNFMYNEATEIKKEVLDYFSLNLIFEKASFGITKQDLKHCLSSSDLLTIRLHQKIIAFEILRNFTAGSPNFNSLLIECYENDFLNFADSKGVFNLPKTWSQFLIFNITNIKIFLPELINSNIDELEVFYKNDSILTKLIQNEDYVKLIRSINHTEDHKYTVIDKIQKYWFPNDDILTIWLRLLSFTIPSNGTISSKNNDKINLFNNLYNIHCSIIWIIVNLTWKYSTFGCTVHEYSKYDVYQNTESSKNLTNNSNSNHRLYIDDDDDEEEDVHAPGQDEQGDVVMADETQQEPASGSSKSDEKKKLQDDDDSNKVQVLSVQERANHLDKLGFTKAIKHLIIYYSEQQQSTDNLFTPSSHKRSALDSRSAAPPPSSFLFAKGHDILEKLETALRQITGLLKGRQGGSANNGGAGGETSNSKRGKGLFAKDLSLDIDGRNVVITKNYIPLRAPGSGEEESEEDDELYRRILARREAIDSEDDGEGEGQYPYGDPDLEEYVSTTRELNYRAELDRAREEVERARQEAAAAEAVAEEGGDGDGDDDVDLDADDDEEEAVEGEYYDRPDSIDSDELPDEYWVM